LQFAADEEILNLNFKFSLNSDKFPKVIILFYLSLAYSNVLNYKGVAEESRNKKILLNRMKPRVFKFWRQILKSGSAKIFHWRSIDVSSPLGFTLLALLLHYVYFIFS
jgi:hypothetical protein